MSGLRRPTIHFSRGWKLLLYAFILLSLGTGSGWFILDRWFVVVDEFDIVQKHPLQPVLLKIHAASAMFVMVGYGYLLATHVHAAWRTRRQRMSGMPLLACIAVLIASSYGLYYTSDETWRARIAWLHLGAGLALPILIAAHVILGHRAGK
jgi:hypothetical protein